MNEQGFTKLKPLPKPLLSEKHQLNQFKWAKIIFIDETMFSQFGKSKQVWRSQGEVIKAVTIKHSAKVHVYVCFSESSFGEIYCFTKRLKAKLLCSIYKKTLLPSAKILFGQDNNSWILQEDNDPKHRSKLAKD